MTNMVIYHIYRNNLLDEIKHNDLISENVSKLDWTLAYLASIVTGCVSISAFRYYEFYIRVKKLCNHCMN